jgi:hypothetical protein
MMRRYSPLGPVWLLTACGVVSQSNAVAEVEVSPVRNCAEAADHARVLRCFEQNHGNGEIPMLLACLPYGPSERMQGIWATALEHSAFYENASDARPEMFQTFGTHLVVDGGPAAALRSMQGEKQRAFRVELIGRRSRCAPAGVWERDVVLERFISARELSVD